MVTRLQVGKDINGTPTGDIPFSDTTMNFFLPANTAVPVAVPAGMQTVFFSFSKDDDVWVNADGTTAVLPTVPNLQLLEDGDEVLLEDGDNQLLEGAGAVQGRIVLNPVAKFVAPGQQLSFISDTDSYVNLSFYTKTMAATGYGGLS